MADNVNVNPTPIQRNKLDVAIELTQLYYKYNSFDTIEEIQETFLRFSAVADLASRNIHNNLKDFLPDNMKDI